MSRQLDYRFTEHGPAHQSKTQFFPLPVPPSGSLKKPLYLIHRRLNRRNKKNYNPAATRIKVTSWKVKQNDSTEDYIPDDRTR